SAEAAASGAAPINRNVRTLGNLSLAWFASDSIATPVAKDSATKTVALPLFDDIASSSSMQVSQQFFRRRHDKSIGKVGCQSCRNDPWSNPWKKAGTIPVGAWTCS